MQVCNCRKRRYGDRRRHQHKLVGARQAFVLFASQCIIDGYQATVGVADE